MDRYKVDFNKVDSMLNAPRMIKYADVADRVEKVAFDIVIFRDKPEQMWQTVTGEDGNEYIVAMYGNASDVPEVKKESWSVEVDRLRKNATIYYKDTPVTSIDIVKTAVDNVDDFRGRVPKMLENNSGLVARMIDGLEEDYRKKILAKHPELSQR